MKEKKSLNWEFISHNSDLISHNSELLSCNYTNYLLERQTHEWKKTSQICKFVSLLYFYF